MDAAIKKTDDHRATVCRHRSSSAAEFVENWRRSAIAWLPFFSPVAVGDKSWVNPRTAQRLPPTIKQRKRLCPAPASRSSPGASATATAKANANAAFRYRAHAFLSFLLCASESNIYAENNGRVRVSLRLSASFRKEGERVDEVKRGRRRCRWLLARRINF